MGTKTGRCLLWWTRLLSLRGLPHIAHSNPTWGKWSRDQEQLSQDWTPSFYHSLSICTWLLYYGWPRMNPSYPQSKVDLCISQVTGKISFTQKERHWSNIYHSFTFILYSCLQLLVTPKVQTVPGISPVYVGTLNYTPIHTIWAI